MSDIANRMMAGAGVLLLQLLLLSQAWADPSVETVTPNEARRDRATTLTLTGLDLAAATAISVSGVRVEVEILEVSENAVVVEVSPGNRAVAGLRSLTVSFSDSDPLTEADAFSVTAGEPEVFSLTPGELSRGSEEVDVRFQGLNLDTITETTIVDGVDVTSFQVDVDDPTRASAKITVGDTAARGAAPVIVQNSDGFSSTLNDGFTVLPAELEVTDLAPTSGTRGATVSINVTGKNLDLITGASFGHAATLDELVLIDPTNLTLTVSIREESTPVGTAREVIFATSDGDLPLPDAFTANAGAFEVTRIRPDRLTQGANVEMTVEGHNLDGLFSFDAGAGINVDSLTPLSAVSALVSISVDLDAELGVRDVAVEGPHGSQTIVEALQVQERVIPPPKVNFPSVTDLGPVEVGARKRTSLLFINEGEVDETVELELVGGDIGDFRFHDPVGETLDELNPSLLLYELPAAGEGIIRVEFRPSLRAGSMATVDVRVRGESIGGITLRGTGLETMLHFSPPPPISVPVVQEGDVGFKQVTTISDVAERVVIEGVEIHVERNDSPFPDGPDLTTVSFSEPLLPEEEYLFGISLFAIETGFPAGAYEGEIWILTDRPTAPVVPITFFTTVTPAPAAEGADEAAEAVEPTPGDAVEADGDMGADMGNDAVVSDMGDDSETDANTGEPTPPTEEGCCRQAGSLAVSPVAILVYLLSLVGLCARRQTANG